MENIHQNHVDRIQKKVVYFLIVTFLQETVIRLNVLASFCSNHRPITFTIAFESNNKRANDAWNMMIFCLKTNTLTN